MAVKLNAIKFPESAALFLNKLSKNNNKEWFNEHRAEYETHLLFPAQMFVEELGERLRTIIPAINAVPKIDKSIFRLHRDVRFSKDKSPYKTNLGLLFWEGNGKKTECSGFYFHIEPKLFFLGTGMYIFTDVQLKKFREIVSNEHKAEELKSLFNKLQKKGYKIEGRTMKICPRSYDKEYKHADLYLYSGVYTGTEMLPLSDLNDVDLCDYVFKSFKEQLPMHKWLVENAG